MSSRLRLRGLYGLSVLTLLLFAAGQAVAETLVFRNDTGSPIVLQAAIVVRGVVRRDKPQPLGPNDVARVTVPGNKMITIYDAKVPTRVLFQGNVPGGNTDLYFSIQPDAKPPNLKIELIKPPK